MQPAKYENLRKFSNYGQCWMMLKLIEAHLQNTGFICSDQKDIDGRIVVLRKSDRSTI